MRASWPASANPIPLVVRAGAPYFHFLLCCHNSSRIHRERLWYILALRMSSIVMVLYCFLICSILGSPRFPFFSFQVQTPMLLYPPTQSHKCKGLPIRHSFILPFPTVDPSILLPSRKDRFSASTIGCKGSLEGLFQPFLSLLDMIAGASTNLSSFHGLPREYSLCMGY